VIADFEAYPDWQPEFTEVEILETDEHGWGTRVRFGVDAKILTARMVLAYTYEPDAMRGRLEGGDGGRPNDRAYGLSDRGDGSTRVDYELSVEPTVPVPGMQRRAAARRIAEGALRGLKRRVEQGR